MYMFNKAKPDGVRLAKDSLIFFQYIENFKQQMYYINSTFPNSLFSFSFITQFFSIG